MSVDGFTFVSVRALPSGYGRERIIGFVLHIYKIIMCPTNNKEKAAR